MTKKVKPVLTAAIVRELLRYDPHTGHFHWQERRLEWFKTEGAWKSWNKRFSGKPAGSVKTREDGTVFLRITIFDKAYSATKLVWLYMTGSWPEGYLTPVDGDSLNLRVDNLLEGYHGKGRSISSRNHSGSTGVSWDKRVKRWAASVGFTVHLLRQPLPLASAVLGHPVQEHRFVSMVNTTPSVTSIYSLKLKR